MAILPTVMAITLTACGGGGGGGPVVKKQFIGVEDNVQDLQGEPAGLAELQMPSYALGLVNAGSSGGSGGYRGKGVRVAVIDSEFDVDHPDISAAFQRNTNGHVIGRNVAEGHNDVRPVERRLSSPRTDIEETVTREEKQTAERDNGYNFSRAISHGTHVAGIIGARNNSFGIVGIAPEAEIVPVTLFRDFDRPSYRYGLSNLNSRSLADWNSRVAKSVAFAAARNPFVINNSWGWSWFPAEINSTSGGYGYRYYFRLPNFFLRSDARQRMEMHRQIFSREAISAWERAVDGGAAVVFAAGNDGWNRETGRHKIYRKPVRGRNREDYRNEKHERYIRTIVRRVGIESEGGVRVEVPANIPDLESSYFLTNPKLRGAWLAVVAVDKRRVITRWSNGCGIAKDYCLAAPGQNIRSTFARGDEDDTASRPEDRADRMRVGDIDQATGDGYGTNSGTSMAAPIVSGALAVLKSKDPQLTARKAVKALLCTATELREGGRSGVTKPTDDAAITTCVATEDDGSGLTYTNGWTPSEVYGHGLVNLARALQPIGPTRAAAADAFGIAPTADTRVAFSAAFGDAAPSATHHFGGFDSLGRVYRFRAPLQDRVMPGPRLAGMLAAAAPPDVMTLRRSDDVTTLLRRSHAADSEIGAGQTVSFLSSRHRTDLSFISARRGAALSPAALLRRDGASPIWDGLAPQARDVIGGRSDWRVADGLRAGIFFTRAKMQAATRRDEAYTIRDYGLSGRIGDGGDSIEARFGRLSESGRFLGSKPEGGYALARPTESTYLRLAASRRLTTRLSIGADIARLRSKVDFRHDAFVRDTVLRARSSSVHLALRDAAVAGDRLVLQHGRPLAVTGGVMRQSSITGYDAAGAYRVTTSDLDLAVRDRHRMTQLVYQRPLGGRLSGFAAAAHHRNWSHRRGLSNNLVMLGLSLRH